LEWVADILAVQGRALTPGDTRHSVSEWDSLGSLLLLSRLEEDHGIVISADELTALTSIQEILDLLERNNAFPAG
jgi:acyl carrier protein